MVDHETIALVTGATSGIGLAVAERLLERGARVICQGRRDDRLRHLVAAHGSRVHPLKLELNDAAAVDDALATLPEPFAAIDVLVASAGHDIGGRRRFDEGDMGEWASIIETNVIGLMRVCHAVLPGMIACGRGHVVTLGSISGLRTYPGGSIYAASKFAVRAFTEGLRRDYPHEPVRITEILPALVRTEFAESRHHGDAGKATAFYDGAAAALAPGDVAATVMFALDQPNSVNIAQIVVTPTGDK